MDTSESEDCFESADEDFLSDKEDSSTDNQESQIEVKKVIEPQQKGDKLGNVDGVKVDNKDLDCNKNKENDLKSRSEFAVIPRRVECSEPGVNSTDVVNCRKEEGFADARLKFFLGPTKCWEPGVNEPMFTNHINTDKSNIKDDKTKSEDNFKAKEAIASFFKKSGIPTAKADCSEPYMNELEAEASNQTSQKSDRPEYGNPKGKIVCLFPEIYHPSKQIPEDQTKIIDDTESQPALKHCMLPTQQDLLNSQETSQEFMKNEKKSLQIETSQIGEVDKCIGKDEVIDVIEGLKKVSVELESGLIRSNKCQEEIKKEDDNMWDNGDEEWESWDKKEEKTLEKKEEKPSQKEKKHVKDSCDGVLQKKDGKPIQETANDDMWGDDEDWGDFEKSSKKEPKTKQDDNLWGDDEGWSEDTKSETPKKSEDISKAFDNLTATSNTDSSTWSGWGNWGIESVLSTAANLTSTVSQGLNTVIGVPDPEELARQHKAEKEKLKDLVVEEELTDDKEDLGFGLGNLVNISKITKLVESTSTKVISGGLDTLETIGKKTMEVLQENDPGLKKKRAFLKIDQKGPVLSQILREAKEKAEEENKELEKLHFTKKANYEMIFDDYQGLVHLEALEMLSRQCDIKLQSLLKKSADSIDLQETLDQVKELCELPEEDNEETLTITEIKEKIDESLTEINIPITYAKLLSTWKENEGWIAEIDFDLVKEAEVHQQAIETLAQLTAICMEQYHKAGELLLIKEHRSTADEADSLSQLTSILSTLISSTASKFSEILNEHAKKSTNKEDINGLITNIYLEADNSSRYIKDAFQLLIPVLQVGAV